MSLSDYTYEARDHLAVRGLLNELPPAGSVWQEKRRREWVDAMVKTLALLYAEEDTEQTPGE